MVDIWLLLIIHANGAPHRKAAESLLKRKVIQGEFTPLLIRLCVHGRGESLQVKLSDVVLLIKETLAFEMICLAELKHSYFYFHGWCDAWS